MGVCVPEELGGAGADFLSYVLVLEELSRADAGVGVTVAVHTSAATLPIVAFGTRRAEARGSSRRSPAARRSARSRSPSPSRARMPARCARRRRRRRRLAHHRREAVDHERQPRRHVPRSSPAPTRRRTGARGVSAFVLDGDHVEVTREEEKLGLNSSSTADIRLDDVRVGPDRLLHEERKGFTVAMATLDGGRIGIAAQAVGIAQAALDTARGYALEREQFGRRIADFQAIQFKLADMATEIAAARLLTLRAAWLKQTGLPHAAGGREGEAVRLAGRGRRRARGDPGARRLRLHDGVPGRAVLPRREDHRDLRGHERDPADRDRARPPADARADAVGAGLRSLSSRHRVRFQRMPRARTSRFASRGSTRAAATRGRRRSATAPASRSSIRGSRAYGTVDELNAPLGVVLAGDAPDAAPGGPRARPERALRPRCRPLRARRRSRAGCGSSRRWSTRSRRTATAFNDDLPELRSFVLPGGTPAAAALHVARTVCRRAERETLAAAASSRGQPARRRLPEPALRSPVHPRARRERDRRSATSRSGSPARHADGLRGRAPSRSDVVRRARSRTSATSATSTSRAGAGSARRSSAELVALTNLLPGPIVEPARDRDRRPPGRQARRARRMARLHAPVRGPHDGARALGATDVAGAGWVHGLELVAAPVVLPR